MSRYDYGFKCAVHSLEFGVAKLPAGYEAWQLKCPLCSIDAEKEAAAVLATVTGHRDLLLKVVDLKRVLSRGEAE